MKMQSLLLKKQEKSAIKGMKYKAFAFLPGFLSDLSQWGLFAIWRLPEAHKYWLGKWRHGHQEDIPGAPELPLLFSPGS